MTKSFEDRAYAEAERLYPYANQVNERRAFQRAALWAREQEPTEDQIDAVIDVLQDMRKHDYPGKPIRGWARAVLLAAKAAK